MSRITKKTKDIYGPHGGFGGYTPFEEPEMQQYMAMDVLAVVQGLLRHCPNPKTEIESVELQAAGDLLEWARECLEYHGLPGEMENRQAVARLQKLRAAGHASEQG